MKVKATLKENVKRIRQWLQGLSFKTGVFVLAMCVPFYIASFAQFALPVSPVVKGVLWAILFGLAKTAQYGGLTIIGVKGLNTLKSYFQKRKTKTNLTVEIEDTLKTE